MALEETLFWIAAALLTYVYVGYPLVMTVIATMLPERRTPRSDSGSWPSVTVVVTAYNEAARIGARLDNLLALDYPSDKLDILVGCDGSTDLTPACARAFTDRGVTVYAFAFRRGKAAMLNNLVPRARGSIVVLADARQRFAADAITSLVRRFDDPSVGAVSGELMLTEMDGPTAVGVGVGFYWRYEKHIRHAESRAGSMVGATGAIYAIRRALFRAIPEDTILDDVLIPMHVARAGYRVVAESRAVAFDQVARSGREEFVRKTRTLAGTFQLLSRHAWLLAPGRNPLWIQTVSHKALRLVCPLLLAAMLLSSAALAATGPFYAAAAAGQCLFYLAAAHGAATGARANSSRLLSVPYAFCLLNLATIVAFWRFAVTGQAVTWDATQTRGTPPAWTGFSSRPSSSLRQ